MVKAHSRRVLAASGALSESSRTPHPVEGAPNPCRKPSRGRSFHQQKYGVVRAYDGHVRSHDLLSSLSRSNGELVGALCGRGLLLHSLLPQGRACRQLAFFCNRSEVTVAGRFIR